MYDYEAEGGKKNEKPRAKRPLSAYNKFVKKCSATAEAKTRSGKDMMKYCASEWKKLSAEQKAAYK